MNQQKPLNQGSINDPLAEELVQTLKHMPNPTRLIDDMEESVAKEEATKEKEREEFEKEHQTDLAATAPSDHEENEATGMSQELDAKNDSTLQDEETLLDKYLKEEDHAKKETLRIQVKDSFAKLLEILSERSLSEGTRKKVEKELTRIVTTFFDEGKRAIAPEKKEEEKPVVTIKPQEEHIISVPLPLTFSQESKEAKQEPVVIPSVPLPPQPPLRLTPLPDTKMSMPSPHREQPITTTSILEPMPGQSSIVSEPPQATSQPPVQFQQVLPESPSATAETQPAMPVLPQQVQSESPRDPFSRESHMVTVNDGSKPPAPTLLAIPQESKGGLFSSFRSIFKK